MAAARFQVVSVGRCAHVPVPREHARQQPQPRKVGAHRSQLGVRQITNWPDPQIKADNVGLTMPGRPIVRAQKPGGSPSAVARRTPALPASAVGALLVALSVCGGVAATLAPVTHFFGASRSNETGEGGDVPERTEASSLPSWLAARLAQLARRR